MSAPTNLKSNEYFLEDIIFLDIEATGLYPLTDRIIQLAMIKVKCDGKIEAYNKYINPCVPKEAQMRAFLIHHISPDMLSEKKPFNAHVQEIYDFIGTTKYLCAHGVWQDWNLLLSEFTRCGEIWGNWLANKEITLINTNKLTNKAFPYCQIQSLQSLANYLKIVITHSAVDEVFSGVSETKVDSIFHIKSAASLHDARTDTIITKQLMFMAIEKLSGQAPKCFSLKDIVEKYPYAATKTYLLDLLDKINDKSNNELKLLDLANTFITSLKPYRGILIKDLSTTALHHEITILSKKLDEINSEREVKLRQLVLKYRK